MATIRWIDGRAEIRLRKPTTGEQTTIRLGRTTPTKAQRTLDWVEQLITAARNGERDEEALRWAHKRPDKLYAKLAAAGLVPPRTPRGPLTLHALLDGFFAAVDVKPATLTRMEQARRAVEEHFGENRDPATITESDADEWRAALKSEGYAAATISRTVLYARQMFRWAVRRGMVPSNPFSELKAGTQVNRERQVFIDRATIAKVIDAARDSEWRLLIVLSRFGGIRVPSEALALKWSDVNWEHNRLTIRSAKTAHHDGRAERIIPLFPEIREHLLAVFDAAPEGAVNVITRYREGSNLNPQLRRIVKAAGIECWPRTWHNLRASRQTELAASYPLHTVCAWMGNTKAIAAGHYLQTTDADWTRAVGETTNPTTTGSAGTRQTPTPTAEKPHSDGSGRGEAVLVGETNGQGRT